VSIQIDPSALRGIKWHEYLTRFILGGTITVITGVIAQRFGPVIGGLFLAFPAIFPASVTLLERHERDKKQRAGIDRTTRGRLAAALDARGTEIGIWGLAAFALTIWRLLPRHNAFVVLLGALVAWLVVSISIWWLRRMPVLRGRGTE
jgi:Protein of unknown function (DUF3147)